MIQLCGSTGDWGAGSGLTIWRRCDMIGSTWWGCGGSWQVLRNWSDGT